VVIVVVVAVAVVMLPTNLAGGALKLIGKMAF